MTRRQRTPESRTERPWCSVVQLIAIGLLSSSGFAVVAGSASASRASLANQSLTQAATRARATPCPAASAPASGTTVPIGVARDGTTRTILIGVCINEQGPFVFALDTGSSASLIAQPVVNDLHLDPAGTKVEVGVVGCSGSNDQPVAVGNWSAGGLDLLPQSVTTGSLGRLAPGLRLDGLLGSDVLARFGAIRIDYDNQTLSLESTESTTGAVAAVAFQAPPTGFDVAETPTVDAGIDVFVESGHVIPVTTVKISRHQYEFIVDTGAALLSVGPKLAKDVHLHALHSVVLSTANCGSTVSIYRGGRGWKLGGVALSGQEILGVPSAGASYGLLGSPVLSHYGAVVVDYLDGRLLLTGSVATT